MKPWSLSLYCWHEMSMFSLNISNVTWDVRYSTVFIKNKTWYFRDSDSLFECYHPEMLISPPWNEIASYIEQCMYSNWFQSDE